MSTPAIKFPHPDLSHLHLVGHGAHWTANSGTLLIVGVIALVAVIKLAASRRS